MTISPVKSTTKIPSKGSLYILYIEGFYSTELTLDIGREAEVKIHELLKYAFTEGQKYRTKEISKLIGAN